ncbi:hypothetical protein BC829DRAFT_489017 [Chytridium lagenaria]|nr:hypothetical protein BC829DRAFT_489017 [Chytridium lagenaria]
MGSILLIPGSSPANAAAVPIAPRDTSAPAASLSAAASSVAAATASPMATLSPMMTSIVAHSMPAPEATSTPETIPVESHPEIAEPAQFSEPEEVEGDAAAEPEEENADATQSEPEDEGDAAADPEEEDAHAAQYEPEEEGDVAAYPEEEDADAAQSPEDFNPEEAGGAEIGEAEPAASDNFIPESSASVAAFPKDDGASNADVEAAGSKNHGRRHKKRRVEDVWEKGSKKEYGSTYYHKKTKYPTNVSVGSGAVAPSIVGSVAYYGNSAVVSGYQTPGTPGVAPTVYGSAAYYGTSGPAASIAPSAAMKPEEEITYKKVHAMKKSGADGRKLKERVRALGERRKLRSKTRVRIRL